jgi:two-component system, NtrC family, sensor histidine kinase KinB
MNLSLRHKFYLGFGGLLAITIIVSSIASSVIQSYSDALQKVLRENYDSVVYSSGMKDAVQNVEEGLQTSLWIDLASGRDSVLAAIPLFEDNLKKEQGNITIPGEREAVSQLSGWWTQYKQVCGAVLDTHRTVHERREIFMRTMLPLGDKVHDAAQVITEMNLANMSSADGQAHAKAEEAKLVTFFLLFSAAILSLLLIFLTGRAVLQPLNALKQSVQEIHKGNLNVVLQARSRDEVGELTEAFNAMVAKLREYRRVEHAKLMRTEHSTRSVIESLPDAIAIANTSGVIELSNAAAQRMFGLYPEVNLTTRRDDLLRHEFFSAVLLEQSSEQMGIPNALQIFKDGEEHFFLPRATPIFDEDRKIIGVAMVLADITRLKRVAELELEPMAVVSHEMKTPLTSVRMALHMLLDERLGTLNTKQLELLSTARDDSERLNKIIETVLDMGRREAGRAPLQLQPCSPQTLISQAVDAFGTAYRSAGVELVSNVPDDIPDVSADASQIGHVFGNLLSNALKFSHSGGKVSVAAAADGDHVKFTVQDQGIGITAEEMPHVFEKFFRSESSLKSEGAGLGLAIAKDIVEAHGGRIWADSLPGQGSIFSFTLRSV